MHEPVPPGGTALSGEQIAALDDRWARHWSPDRVARRLEGVSAPWCVAAGWALDLFRGERTRPHTDLEIAVPAARFDEIRDRFAGLAVDTVSSGRLWRDAGADVLAATHQTWLRDPETDDYVVDVFREPHDGDTWICRHDPTIRLPYREVIRHSADGIPYLAPEFVLLFKSEHARPKDEADFEATLPHLAPNQRATLAEMLHRVHPGHAWLTLLG